jgi:hypothetical protein
MQSAANAAEEPTPDPSISRRARTQKYSRCTTVKIRFATRQKLRPFRQHAAILKP